LIVTFAKSERGQVSLSKSLPNCAAMARRKGTKKGTKRVGTSRGSIISPKGEKDHAGGEKRYLGGNCKSGPKVYVRKVASPRFTDRCKTLRQVETRKSKEIWKQCKRNAGCKEIRTRISKRGDLCERTTHVGRQTADKRKSLT